MTYTIYHKNKDYWILRLKNGKFKKVLPPKFFDEEIVTTSKKHFSPKAITIVFDPKYVANKGWYYGERYCHIENNKVIVGGGCSFSWEEDLFSEVTDTKTKILTEIYYRNLVKTKLLKELNKINNELECLEFSKSLI